MKKIFLFLMMLVLVCFSIKSMAAVLPVYSTNGFVCQKVGVSVTCKGPIPGGKDSVTATGHNLVYLTMDVVQGGSPTRYTYFSDTGCLVGYTFGEQGKPIAAVAVHRNGTKGSFDIKNDNYDSMIQYCEQELPGSPQPVAGGVLQKPKEVAKNPAPAKPTAVKPAQKKANSSSKSK
jgi:hypothetical protein